MSFLQRATTGALSTLVWSCFSKKVRKASLASSKFIDLGKSGSPMNEYSTQGASPQSSRSIIDQKEHLHLVHVCLVKPDSWKKFRDMPSLTIS